MDPCSHPRGHHSAPAGRFSPFLLTPSHCPPDLARLPVPSGDNPGPYTCSALVFPTLHCQGSPPLLGTPSLLDSPSPIVSVEGQGRARGKEVGCSAPCLPPATLLAALQALSPGGQGASEAPGGQSLVQTWRERGGCQAYIFKSHPPPAPKQKTQPKTVSPKQGKCSN